MTPFFKLTPFTDAGLAVAGQLLAACHQQDCQQLASLPARFSDPATACRAVEVLWQRPLTSGVAAWQGDRLLGYMIGSVSISNLLGRSVWLRPAGYAVAPGIDADLYRDLYAAAAPAWMQMGAFDHYIQLLLADRACQEAWYALGFGQQQAYGLYSLTTLPLQPPPVPPGVTIRRGTPADRQGIAAIATVNVTHQTQAPIWAPMLPEELADLRTGYAEVLSEPGWIAWLALRQEEIIGAQLYVPCTPGDDDLLTPAGCIELKAGTVIPAERGQGIGQALTYAGLAQAKAEGFAYCLADWRVTNLQASRFWPRQGFQPIAHRLHRRIDERVLWAQGDERWRKGSGSGSFDH